MWFEGTNNVVDDSQLVYNLLIVDQLQLLATGYNA